MFEELKMTEIQQILFKYQDQKYADFISKLVPTVPKQNFIGIRSPVYKKIIKEINENLSTTIIENFLKELPHKYHEENCLHVYFITTLPLLNLQKDCLNRIDRLLRFGRGRTVPQSQ